MHGYAETCEAICESKPHLREEYDLLKSAGAERPIESNLTEILEEYGEICETGTFYCDRCPNSE